MMVVPMPRQMVMDASDCTRRDTPGAGLNSFTQTHMMMWGGRMSAVACRSDLDGIIGHLLGDGHGGSTGLESLLRDAAHAAAFGTGTTWGRGQGGKNKARDEK